jgi:hypothetical protein
MFGLTSLLVLIMGISCLGMFVELLILAVFLIVRERI